jgi:hypothetical protein
VDDDVLYCPACGKKLPDKTMPQGGVNPPPYYAPSNAPPAFGEADAKAMRRLTIFAIIILATFILSFSLSFLFNPFRYLLIANPAAVGSATPTFITGPNFLTYVTISGVVALVIEIFTFLQLRGAFKTLSTVDRPRFKTPSTLALLLVIALPIFIVGVIIEVSGLVPFLNAVAQQQQAGQPITAPSLSGFGEFFAGVALAFIGGIITLIGFIGGLILGIWRLGSRYDETLFKVAAILFIIPLLDIISPILILIGAIQVRKRIVAQPSMP